jgi:aarF domain-containing kinase
MAKSYVKRGAFVVGCMVGAPVAAGVGLVAYVKYRTTTKPKEVSFRPLVSADGSLVLKDLVIPPPTRWMIIKRVAELIRIFLPVAFLYLFMCWNAKLHRQWMELLLAGVEDAGAAFIKFGQWSCTRKDIFSDELREVFEKLYSEVKEHPIEETLKIIEEDLKTAPENVFSKIEPATCGSGSIGQVHIAYLKGSDEKVVVKVMHPNVIATISQDFWIINRSARFFDKYFHSLERFEIVKLALAFTNHLAAQLDFRIEAEHLEIFREHFKGLDYCEFPKPLLSSMRVLVESYAKGEPATPDFLRKQEPHAREILAGKGLNIFCKMLLRDNFLHGDMHPGNILIDVSDPHSPKITMIDVGLCQKLTSEEGTATFNLMSSFVHWDPVVCVDSLWNMADEQRFANRKKFSDELSVMFELFRPVTDRDDQVVSNILESMFEVVRDNHVQMEPPYVSLLFAVLVLEGFIMNLDPNFNMVRHAAPWLVSEGHISPGLVRNIALGGIDRITSAAGAARGRVRDFVTGGNESANKIVINEGVVLHK